MRLSLFHRHTLSVLCAGLFLCGSLLTAPKAEAAPTLLRTLIVAASTASVGTIKQIRVASDGSSIVQGSSRTSMNKINSAGDTLAVLSYSPALSCTTVNSFVLTGSTLFSTCAASTAIPKHQISGTTVIGTATGTLASSTGNSDIYLRPNGNILVNKGTTLYELDSSMNTLFTKTTTASALRLAEDGSHNVFYVTATRVLRKFNLDTLTDTILKTFSSGTGAKGLYAASNGTTYYADATDGIHKTTATGSALWRLAYSSPASIDLDTSGNIFIINTSGVVKVYSPINEVSVFSATPTASDVLLEWTTGIADSDFSGVTIRRSTSSYPLTPTDGSPVTSANLGTSFTDSSLPDGTYYYSIFNRTSDGYYSTVVATSAIVDPNPGPVTGLTATASGTTISLSWTNPADSDFSAVRIVRSTSGNPTSISDGVLVQPESNVSSATQTGMTDGTHYYGVFAKDTAGNYSLVANANATVDTTGPSAPTLTTTATDNRIDLSWDTPASTSTFVIRWSTVSAPANTAAGSLLATLTSSDTTYSHTGLSNGTYYYSIFAKDAFNNPSVAGSASTTINVVSSSSSSASSTVTTTVSHGGGRGGRGTTGPRTAIVSTHPAAIVTTPAKPPMSVEVRTCTRVQKQFFGEALKRVNERLLKRLGFGC